MLDSKLKEGMQVLVDTDGPLQAVAHPKCLALNRVPQPFCVWFLKGWAILRLALLPSQPLNPPNSRSM